MHLQLFGAAGEVAVADFCVVFLVGNLTEEIYAVKLVENLKTDSVTLHSSLGVNSLKMIGGHANNFTLLVGDDLVADYFQN